LQFLIQLVLLLVIYFIIVLQGGEHRITGNFIYLPLLVLQLAILGMGVGIIISSLTIKYRDLHYLLGFGLQLWMYATPIIYPVSLVPDKFKVLYVLNPTVTIIQNFRLIFLNIGTFDLYLTVYSTLLPLIILFIGIIIFNQTEKKFIDTI